jgi:hypothetical protein
MLAEHLFFIQKICGDVTQNCHQLCHHLTRSATLMSTVLSIAAMRATITLDSSENQPKKDSVPGPVKARKDALADISTVFRAISRAFGCILFASSKLAKPEKTENSESTDALLNHVTYSVVTLFDRVLIAINEVSACHAENLALSNSKEKPTKPKCKAKQKLSKGTDICRALSQLVIAMVACLKPSERYHREIFEGFLYVLFRRIGSRLYICTFERLRSVTIDGDITASTESCPSDSNETQNLDTKALLSEIPSLVSILERSLALAPLYLEPTSTMNSGSKTTSGARQVENPKTANSGSKNRLSYDAKERLQATLVNCMFGPDSAAELGQCMRMPYPPKPSLPAPAKVQEEDIKEWFKQEVWRLVGWQLLGQEVDL